MIRLLGAITGSALALATLLVLVGIPQFKADPVEIERSVVTLPLPTAAVDDAQTQAQIVPQPSTTAASAAEAVAEPPIDALPIETLPAEPLGEPVAEFVPEPFIEESEEEAPILPIDAQNWYAFWSPFRSEIAASGFVSQLQRVTGLDYRVVKTKPGVYEVAFAYGSDNDIPLNLSQITAATGLEMPES